MLVSFFKTVFRHVSFFLFGVVVFPQIAKPIGFLFQVYEELHVCVMERACWYRCRVPLLPEWCLRFGAGMLVPLQGAAAVRVVCAL